uniref:Dynactin subunit 6 n=1 Tax=Eutreptiella gymnastica TaxID=73025 RepID=A0A7S1NE23_9EUGL|mmetsp:Transcript_21179/g.37971  ORF Transcript_21179/g.37971 Transcript_21179/m.37971 type:complete len:264 (+) Transcript_21179:55-846(+)
MANPAQSGMRNLGQAVRECGQALDRCGSFLQGRYAHLEKLQRHRRINAYFNFLPVVKEAKFIAPSASVIGQVDMRPGCTVWYNSVIRGDRGKVSIGSGTHIMDRVVIRSGIMSVRDVNIGSNVVIEAGAVVGPCKIADGAHIGANAVLLEGCTIGPNVVIADGAVVPEFAELTAPGVYSGVPAKASSILSKEEEEAMATKRENLAALAIDHEMMNTKTIEQATAERVVLKDILEEQLNNGDDFYIKNHHINRAPNISPAGHVE